MFQTLPFTVISTTSTVTISITTSRSRQNQNSNLFQQISTIPTLPSLISKPNVNNPQNLLQPIFIFLPTFHHILLSSKIASIHLNGFTPDTFLQTKILMLYARADGLSDLRVAQELFDEMSKRNSIPWNTMILAYARVDDHAEMLELFCRMWGSGILPYKFTFPSVVKACVAVEDCDGVRQVQVLIFKIGLNCNSVVGGSLVDGYARIGPMSDAVSAFEEIDDQNVVAWNVIVGGYARVMKWIEAWGFFHKMGKFGVVPDNFTFATMLRICGSLRSLDRGKQMHAKLIIHGCESNVFMGHVCKMWG